MAEANETPEFYSDQFMVSGGPYGLVINFKASPPEPGPGKVPDTVARVRMSYELVKTLTDLGVGMEDWQAFWKSPPEFRE